MSTAAKAVLWLLVLVASWAALPLLLVAFAVAVWWHRPRNVTQVTLGQVVTPVQERPMPNVCMDCSRVQGPSLTTCWFCSAGSSRLRPVDPSDTVELYV